MPRGRVHSDGGSPSSLAWEALYGLWHRVSMNRLVQSCVHNTVPTYVRACALCSALALRFRSGPALRRDPLSPHPSRRQKKSLAHGSRRGPPGGCKNRRFVPVRIDAPQPCCHRSRHRRETLPTLHAPHDAQIRKSTTTDVGSVASIPGPAAADASDSV